MALVSTYSFIMLTEIIQKHNTLPIGLKIFLVAYESCNRKFNFKSNEVEKHTTTKFPESVFIEYNREGN